MQPVHRQEDGRAVAERHEQALRAEGDGAGRRHDAAAEQVTGADRPARGQLEAGDAAGLVDCPVIAVPTSIGYGAAFHGLAPLLTMLNACAANVVVVNIDSGFKGGYVAALIARRAAGPRKTES